MSGFIQGADRNQGHLLPERIDEYVSEENPVRVIEAFVEELDLAKLGFARVEPNATGRPAYHPATLLKIYLNGYLNRVQSSRRLEQEGRRNLELMWLTGRLAPDSKTLADFRADNGAAIRGVCREFIVLCRRLGLFSQAIVAIDGSKFKAVNHRDRNFTSAKMKLPCAVNRLRCTQADFGFLEIVLRLCASTRLSMLISRYGWNCKPASRQRLSSTLMFKDDYKRFRLSRANRKTESAHQFGRLS
jgi:transposase